MHTVLLVMSADLEKRTESEDGSDTRLNVSEEDVAMAVEMKNKANEFFKCKRRTIFQYAKG